MMLFLHLQKLLFPPPIILLFSVQLASRDQLYHAKNWLFDIDEFSADIASSMLFASVHWDNIDALSDCFNITLTDILDKHAPLKQGLSSKDPVV